jgi:pantetheine-phosphate adenylyltransferase
MIALFAGSFDPPSFGHLDIIRKAASLFDRLIVGVAVNLKKKSNSMFSTEEKVELLKKITSDLSNVEIAAFSHLAVDFAKQRGAGVLVRGIRAYSDLNAEFQMALANRHLGNLETLFLLGDEQYSHISSTIIREIVHAKGSLATFIPPEIEVIVRSKIS